MFGKMYLIIISLLLLLVSPVHAGYQFFKVPLKDAAWSVQTSPILCSLRYPIPVYGEVEFSRRVKSELEFSLHVKQAANRPEYARLRSQAPEWKHVSFNKDFGRIPVVEGKTPFYLKDIWAKRMLAELSEGMELKFSYRDWSDGRDEITVIITAINFHEAWAEFQQCEKQLLNFNFADVKKTVIQYSVGKTGLERNVQHRLDQMIHYMKEDPSVRGVRVDGYTDSKGLQRINIVVARRRTNTVRNYFISNGIEKDRISAKAHSELEGKFSNRTVAGRKKNRRVEVMLIR